MRMRFAGIALLATIVACGYSQPVSIVQVTVSGDETRLEIVVDSCNASLDVDVAESDEAVAISASRIDRDFFSGGDCQDLRIHQLGGVLAGRPVIDGVTGAPISVLSSPSADESLWPYDTSRFSEAEYEAALDDMVNCLMERDPNVTAWVFQSLDYKSYSWDKEPNAIGTVSTEALEPCTQEHLAPLE